MNNSPPNEDFKSMNPWQKIDLFKALSRLPALPLLVLIHKRVGYRVARPFWLGAITGILLLSSLFLHPLMKPYGFLMPLFATAVLVAGGFHRRRGWRDLCDGARWHTRSGGESYLETLPWLPEALKINRRIYRWAEPVIAAIAAIPIGLFLSHGVGLAIAFSSLGLAVYEQVKWERWIDETCNTQDGILEAEAQAEDARRMEAPRPEQHAKTAAAEVGLPTAGVEIAQHGIEIQARRAKRRGQQIQQLEPVSSGRS